MKHREPVGRHLVAAVARARPEERVEAVRARLAHEKPSSLELVLVAGADGRLAGVVPIARIFSTAAHALVGEAMDREFPRVTPDTDQERAASLALHHGVDALPVIDADGRPLGVMGSALATATMAGFEATLASNIAVAFFVPGIVYLADAIGTQSEAIAVRGLSLSRSGIGHLLAGELRTGMLIGACLGLISFVPVWAILREPQLAAAVATAIFAAGTVAAALGLLLPWWLARSGRDPAFGAGPLATVIQDILSILVYFAVVRAFGI